MKSMSLVLVISMLFQVNGFQLTSGRKWSSRTSSIKPSQMMASGDQCLGHMVQRNSLAKDIFGGNIGRQMLTNAQKDAVWEGILNEPKVLFVPSDAPITTEERDSRVRMLLEVLANQTQTSPTVDFIKNMLKSFIHLNGHMTLDIKKLQALREHLVDALRTVSYLVDLHESESGTVPSVMLVPKVYETVAPGATAGTMATPLMFGTHQEYVNYLKDTWHLRRQLEERAQAEEIQKSLDKAKPLQLDDWYCLNPPGYY